ncbi:MAG: hypothetical protein ASQ68_gp05 [Yellowstone Lake virophage 6]|uniref:hypothetical protein n=1 Tax=Yellowstone Lake virophage 6 TaxID=1557034 RepID=UPI000535C736|nr:MAG: hypothetical protein ASQ68_gp05 [Yellowstone Lake virophage 6]AIW01895.1 MAG: hypothetical protein YSLV6_ORF05 [Yellowstone Lake virophage 6]
MPRKEINYQKSVIYKIEHLEKLELLYIGSTTDFIKRKNSHKSNSTNQKNKSKYNLKLYQMIRENGGWDCFKIMIIKEYPCLNKIELLIEEDKMMKELKSLLNSKKAIFSYNEYYEENKDKMKEYYEENKDKIKEYKNKTYLCDCGCKIRIDNKYNHNKTDKHLNNILN